MCLRKDYYVFARTSIIICISISIICIWNIMCICNMKTRRAVLLDYNGRAVVTEQQGLLVFMLQMHMMFQIQMMLMLIQMMMLVLAKK